MKFRDVQSAVEWVEAEKGKKGNNTVKKVALALAYLGNPHRGLPVIHITGTNGKGSTTAYLRDLLQSQGLRVGTFTSPHIMRFNERITYNDEAISDEDFLRLIDRVYAVNDYMATTVYGRMAFFEIYTVVMALYFAEKTPDICLIEVGIGGYSDATFVFDSQIAIITSIDIDHADKLGYTVESVAYEKSGIIKRGSLVVVGEIPPSCQQLIQGKIMAEMARGFHYGHDFTVTAMENLKTAGTNFSWTSHDGTSLMVHINMIGGHQVHNAALALEACSLWFTRVLGRSVDWPRALAVLSQTQWLARMERIHQTPLLYIDGAHNVSGLQALKRMMEDYFDDYEYTILYAGLSTKNQAEQLPILTEMQAKEIYLTEFDHDKAMTAEGFASLRAIDAVVPPIVSWQDFIRDYLSRPQPANHLLLATGSLYFASDVRKYVTLHYQK